jgi:hypothetical protein
MTDHDTEDQRDPEVAYTKLSSKVKRGTGTRDQDTIKVVTRHAYPEVAVKDHLEALSALSDLADDVRAIQPEDSHED